MRSLAVWIERISQGRRSRIMAAGALVLLLVGAITFLAFEVRDRLDALERANSDNTQWVMMQAEVEVLRLQQAIAEAQKVTDPARLDEVRRWFNVLYSRISMLEQSPIYAPLLATEGYETDHAFIRAYLDATVDLIDASDLELGGGLNRVAGDLPAVRAAAREMTLNALSDFAAQSDMNRESMAGTLIRLAVLVMALVLLLGSSAIILARLFLRSQAQAEALRVTGERLATIVTTSADGIVVTDVDGRIRAFNPAAGSIFGLGPDEVMGRNALKLLFAEEPEGPQQTALLTALRNPAPGSDPLRIEVDARRKDGSTFPAEVSIARPSETVGSDEGLVVAFVRDISDRRAAERDLTLALDRALAGERAKADFLAVMSHEMRTPLTGLLGSLELLRQGELTPVQRDLADVMERSGTLLLDHVNSVLDLSRAEASAGTAETAEFDLDRVVEDVIANQSGLARAAGNEIRLTLLSGPIGRVRGHGGRLRQILLNLVGNAVKFTRDGIITVETERLPASKRDETPLVEFRVSDTGIGIPEADLDRIFEDFVTLDTGYSRMADGTGLGLGIARRLVRALGGDIGAESEPGEGSLFWVRLPLPSVPDAAPPPDGVNALALHPVTSVPPLDILLVDDHRTNRLIMRRFLESAGHRVTEAGDGESAVVEAGRRRFDTILMDISMPRMDGITATRAIRTGNGPSAQSRILALTAHALPEERVAFRAAGMEACLTKPIGQQALLAALSRHDFDDGDDGATRHALVDETVLRELVRHVVP